MISARLCRVHTKSNRSQVLRSTKIRDNPYLLLRLRSFIYSLFVVVLPIQSIYHITTTIICTRDFPYKLHFHKKAQFFRTKTNSKYTEHRGLTIPTTQRDPRRNEGSIKVCLYLCMHEGRGTVPYRNNNGRPTKQRNTTGIILSNDANHPNLFALLFYCHRIHSDALDSIPHSPCHL